MKERNFSRDIAEALDRVGSPRLADCEAVAGHPMSLRQRLTLAVQQAEERLAAVKRAREIFEKNPDLEELLNIMQRSHF